MGSGDRVRGLAQLVAGAVHGGVGTAQDMHASIARLPFGALALTPLGAPAGLARGVHDGITGGIYGGLRVLARVAGAALASPDEPEPDDGAGDPLLDLAISALNGFVGDRLERERNGLRMRMELRHRDRTLVPDPQALRRAFPAASPRVAVFVHGLASNDRVWRFYSEEHYGDPDTTYGSQLERDFGYCPLYLRYNSGLHVSENGALLSSLMEQLLRAWPVPIEEIALVGHSMGGLVSRSACHDGRQRGARWVDAVRHVFCLGSPHGGAPLEKMGNLLGWALESLEVTRPLGRIVNGRSAGIKDLRYGYLVEEDWRDKDPDALLENHRHGVPLLDTAAHYFIAATVTASPSHPVGWVLGDTLVRFPSACRNDDARVRRVPVRDPSRAHLGGTTHLRLLNHPAVYDQIRFWLGAARAASEVRASLPQERNDG